MRQVNLAVIFIFCLGFAIFGIENTELGTIHLTPGVEIQAPISVELLIALGLGGVMAWLFSLWINLQGLFRSRQKVDRKDDRIEELECKIEEYQAQLQSLQLSLPPARDSVAQEAEVNA